MINLSQLKKPDGNRPIIATLVGEAGMGKTSLASLFPNPVIIRTEDGTMSLAGRDDVSLFDLATSSQDVFDQIEALATGEHNFKTVVIDSITQLATMIENEIVAADPKAKSINQAGGGYGAGYNTAARVHGQIREWIGALAYERGMNVIFISHADTETLDLPDMDPYTRYTVRMHKKSLPHYTDNVDMVAHIRLKTFTRGEGDTKRAISTGEREIICHPVASSVTKNRFGITEPIPFTINENPFAAYVAN